MNHYSIVELIAQNSVYIVAFGVFFLFALLDTVIKVCYSRILSVISLVFLCLLTGLRWETGTDWDSYHEFFKTVEPTFAYIVNVQDFDIGYTLINIGFRFFSENYSYFLILIGLLTSILIWIAISSMSPMPNLSILYFYCGYFISHFMGSNRRMIAIGFFLLGVVSIAKKESFKSYICYIFSFLFHRTSLVSVFTYFINANKGGSIKLLYIATFVSFLGILEVPVAVVEFFANHLQPLLSIELFTKALYYVETASEHVPDTVNSTLQIGLSSIKRLVFIIFYIYTIRSKDVGIETVYLVNVYLVGFIIYLAFSTVPIFQITSTYFSIVEILILPRILIEYTSRFRVLIVLALFPFMLLQLFNALNPYYELYVPYKSILE